MKATGQEVRSKEHGSKALFEPVSELMEQVERAMYEILQSPDPLVDEVATHLLRSGGKRVRPALVLLAASLAGDVEPFRTSLLEVAASVELIHMATLVHDDIVDESDLRRGTATVHARWDEQIGVLSGDYLFARAFTALAETGNNRVVRVMSDVVSEMSVGEINQLRQAHQQQAEEDYLSRIYRKTAYFISQSCRLGGIVAELGEAAEEALSSYGHGVGMAYQLIDDILDFVGTEEEFGKPVGSDIQAGLYTLPLLYAMEKSPHRQELLRLVKYKELGSEELARIVELVRDSGAIEHSYGRARVYIHRARAALAPFESSPVKAALLALSDFVQYRNH